MPWREQNGQLIWDEDGPIESWGDPQNPMDQGQSPDPPPELGPQAYFDPIIGQWVNGGTLPWIQQPDGGWLPDYEGHRNLSNQEAPPQEEGGGGGGWFGANLPQRREFEWNEQYSPLERPDYLRGEYKPPEWNETFTPLTMEQVQQAPGYQVGLNSGVLARERSASARGSLLGGGQQKALERFAQDYGQNFYGTENDRAMNNYMTRYNAFMDSANLGAQARGINEQAYGTDLGANRDAYDRRYQTYLDRLNNDYRYDALDLQAILGGRP